jgi:hypothetical protein
VADIKALIFFLISYSAICSAEFSGRLRGEEQGFFATQGAGTPQDESSLQIELEEHQVFWETWKFKFEPRVRLSSEPRMVDVPVDGDFRDTLIEKKIGSTHIQAGSFIKTWEGTDGLNPMDIATMRNYREPLNAENIGSVGLAASGSFIEDLSWEVLYVPWQTPTRLPGDNSPWWPHHTHLPLEVNNTQLLLPDNGPQYEILHHDVLNRALNDNYGGRLQFHQGAWDVSAAYFEGAAQIPIFQPLVNGNLVESSPRVVVKMANPVGIQPIEYRRRTYAASIVSTQQSWIFRWAGRYDQPIGNDSSLPGWSDQMVGGVEKTFAIHAQTVILLAEFTYEDQIAVTQNILASPDPFRRAILLGMRVPYSDELLFYLSGLMDVQNGSSLARFNVQRKFGDHWIVDGTAEWIHGSADTLLGLWQDQSRAIVGGTYQF